MKGETLTRELIESILRVSNQDYVQATQEKVRGLVSLAVESLSTQIPYVNFNNVIFEPVNEALSGGFTDNSVFEFFLGVDNPQLEINTMRNDIWNRVKNRVITAWKNRNDGKKRRKKKSKEEKIKYNEFNPEHYNLSSLAKDMMLTMANYLSETSLIFSQGNSIKIIGKDDFGSNTQIFIHFTLYNEEFYRYYINHKRGFYKFNNQLRIAAINNKYNKVGQSYIDMIKVFNTLYFNINHKIPNQIFIESLLYNCPDELYVSKPYDAFIKILNYLSMANTKDFKSIVNPDKTIFTDTACGNTALGYKKMLSKLIDITVA